MVGQIGFHCTVGLDAVSAVSQDVGTHARLKVFDNGKGMDLLPGLFDSAFQHMLGVGCGEGTLRRSLPGSFCTVSAALFGLQA